MPFDFTGQTAVVTGGGNGIGLATARVLAAGGAAVWILDLEREFPAEVAASFGARGIAADVTRPESLDAAFDAACGADGAPAIVMANAGAVAEAELTDTTAATWDRIVAVNLSGAFHTLQRAARRMQKQRRGTIVVTASTNSYDGEARLTAYNATKAGLLGIVHTAANELGPYGIRINAVCPGLIRTRLTETHFTNPALLKEYFRHIPLGRGGQPEEVAQACAFLASNLASFITGATLLVDGGQMASKFGTWSEERADFADGRWRLR